MVPYVSTAEACGICQVTPKTIRKWATTGAIPSDAWFVTPGGHLRFHREPFTRWVRERGFEPPPAAEARS